MVHYTTYKFIRVHVHHKHKKLDQLIKRTTVHVHHKHKKAKSIDKMYIVKHCEGVIKLFFSFVGNHPRMVQYTVFKPLKHLWGQKLVEFLRKRHQVNRYIQRPLSVHSITGAIMPLGFLHQHCTDTVQ